MIRFGSNRRGFRPAILPAGPSLRLELRTFEFNANGSTIDLKTILVRAIVGPTLVQGFFGDLDANLLKTAFELLERERLCRLCRVRR